MDKFRDRTEAGIALAAELKSYASLPKLMVLALPRGGVPVGFEIAKALGAPFDIFIVRKLGVPGHEELAMGAIASGDTVIYNKLILNQLNIDQTSIDKVLKKEQAELARRDRLYRGKRRSLKLKGKTIILVDDGIATGATMQAAVAAIRKHKPAAIIIAVPVAAQDTYEDMLKLADKVICLLHPINFYAVGLWYEIFSQTSDDEVIELLEKSKH